jgi:hypothetical protein
MIIVFIRNSFFEPTKIDNCVSKIGSRTVCILNRCSSLIIIDTGWHVFTIFIDNLFCRFFLVKVLRFSRGEGRSDRSKIQNFRKCFYGILKYQNESICVRKRF